MTMIIGRRPGGRPDADPRGPRRLFEQAPVEFAETFFRNYSDGQWISKERNQLVSAVERAEEVDGGTRS